MTHAASSKSAAAALLDPLTAPEPAAADGPGSHFGSTFAPASEINGITRSPPPAAAATSSSPSSNNPYRQGSVRSNRASSIQNSPPLSSSKGGAHTSVRSSSGSPRPEKFPHYRTEVFSDFDDHVSSRNRASSHGTPPSYQEATSSSPNQGTRPRRGSSLRERYPGDNSTHPLDIIRRDSRKAYRSPHLNKRSLPGADTIDRLDPAIGGRAYHHEGPYDAALLSRNRDPKNAPLAALEDSNREALRATPRENIRDSIDRHQPLDGVADVPPGQEDRFGRTYHYQEGADLMHESANGEPAYKQYPGAEYDPEDLKGKGEPAFSLDRALRAHKISDPNDPIELQDRSRISREYHRAERRGTLDKRDPVDIAGGEQRYADLEIAAVRAGASHDSDVKGHSMSSGLGSLKKRIGSLRKKDRDD